MIRDGETEPLSCSVSAKISQRGGGGYQKKVLDVSKIEVKFAAAALRVCLRIIPRQSIVVVLSMGRGSVAFYNRLLPCHTVTGQPPLVTIQMNKNIRESSSLYQ